jgi:hypothetical protein
MAGQKAKQILRCAKDDKIREVSIGPTGQSISMMVAKRKTLQMRQNIAVWRRSLLI